MGNSNDKPAMGAFRPAKENRSYLIEVPSESGRRSESPLPPGSNILVEDTTNSARFIDIPNQNNRRRPVLCYQSSSDYGSEDMPEEFTVMFPQFSHFSYIPNQFFSRDSRTVSVIYM